MPRQKKRSLSKELGEGFKALKKLRPIAETILVCNGCGKKLKQGETMVCKGCRKKTDAGLKIIKDHIVYKCKRCDKRLNPENMTFGAGGHWCSDYCAERYLSERGML